MEKCFRIIIFIILISGFIFESINAQIKTLNNHSSTYAVVIGISDYQDPAIPDLRFAHKDAEAFANYLRSPSGGSLDEDHLKVLTNEQATAGRIAEALDGLIEIAKEEDQVIIYFSGHGDVEGKKISQPGFLLCWDAPSRVYMGGGTYSLSFLQEVVSTLSIQNKAKVIVITDACHAGKLAGSQIGGAQLTSANLAKQYANEVKMLSCQPNEYSIEGEQWGGGRGAFSYNLVEALYGLADSNNDLFVTLQEISRYLEDQVPIAVAPLSQFPLVLGNRSDRIAKVNSEVLSNLKNQKTEHMIVFASTDSRGFEEEILSNADTIVGELYHAFKLAVNEKRLLEPKGNCAEYYYNKLLNESALSSLHGIMRRNYAAALQDDAQQVMNTMLKTGLTTEVLKKANSTLVYRNYPAYLERATELLGSEHYMYKTLQARKYFFEGKITEIYRIKRQKFYQALEWQADLPHAHVELIQTFRAAEVDSAKLYASKAMQLVPSWIVPYTTLAYFMESKLNDSEKAEQLLAQAFQVDSTAMLVWYSKAHFYARQKNYTLAEYWYKKVIAGSGEEICFPCAHNGLAGVYLATKRFPEAEEQYNKAIFLDSTFYTSYGNLGILYKTIGRYAEAEQYYRKAIDLDSTYVKGYTDLGSLYNQTRQYALAEEQFNKAIQLDSASASAHGYLGSTYRTTGRYDEAEKQLLQAVNLDPSLSNFYTELGQLYMATKRNADAEKYLIKCIQVDSISAHAYTILGLYYNETGRYVEGEQILKKAIQIDSTFGLAWYNLACNQALQKQMDHVFEILDKSLQYDPYRIATYNNPSFLHRDTDLTPLREQKEAWTALMIKYFPDQFKK